MKSIVTALDDLKNNFDSAADVVTQMHKHFVVEDTLK